MVCRRRTRVMTRCSRLDRVAFCAAAARSQPRPFAHGRQCAEALDSSSFVAEGALRKSVACVRRRSRRHPTTTEGARRSGARSLLQRSQSRQCDRGTKKRRRVPDSIRGVPRRPRSAPGVHDQTPGLAWSPRRCTRVVSRSRVAVPPVSPRCFRRRCPRLATLGILPPRISRFPWLRALPRADRDPGEVSRNGSSVTGPPEPAIGPLGDTQPARRPR